MREQAVRTGGQPEEIPPEPGRAGTPRVPDGETDTDRLDTAEITAGSTAARPATGNETTAELTSGELPLPEDANPPSAAGPGPEGAAGGDGVVPETSPEATPLPAAEPERSEPAGDRPVWQRPPRRPFKVHVAFTLVLLIAAAGVVRIAQYHWREGSVLIGGALLVAALLRAVLPPTQVGLMAVRGRTVDVLTYTALAACVLFITITLQNGPYA